MSALTHAIRAREDLDDELEVLQLQPIPTDSVVREQRIIRFQQLKRCQDNLANTVDILRMDGRET